LGRRELLSVVPQHCLAALGSPRDDGVGLVAAECQRSAQDVLHGMGMAARRNCTDPHSFSTADYAAGWERAAVNVTAAWSHSPPDLTG